MSDWWNCPGCKARNDPKHDACENCGETRVGEIVTPPVVARGFTCQDCAAPASPKLGAIVVDGEYLCLECRSLRFRSIRVADVKHNGCGEPGCTKTIAEHAAEIKASVQKITTRSVEARDGFAAIGPLRTPALPPATGLTCAECARPIEDHAHGVYEDGRSWHAVCWPAREARVRLARKHERERRAKGYAPRAMDMRERR